jgi:hypothetical protein
VSTVGSIRSGINNTYVLVQFHVIRNIEFNIRFMETNRVRREGRKENADHSLI